MITLTAEQAQQIEEALKKTIAGCKAMGWTTVAQEAGCHAYVITGAVCFNPDVLERFVAHERQKMQTELLTLEKWKGIASAKFGDGRTVNEIEREAREAEREACAKVCEEVDVNNKGFPLNAKTYAAAIRARSN